MKDQSGKNFHSAPRHIPTKNEEVVKTEDTLLTGEMKQIAIQEELLTKPEKNHFRKPNSQQAYNYEFDTYYNRSNYHNYNCRNNFKRQYQQQEQKIRTPQSNMREVQQIQKKNPFTRNDI